MTDDIQLELLRIYEAFPGIVTPSSEALGSHLHLPTKDTENVVAVLAFEENVDGTAAELIADYVMSVRGGEKETSLACGCADDGSFFYACTAKQIRAFARHLDYGSHRPMGKKRAQSALTSTPIPVLLSHAFASFTHDYHQSAERTTPHLGVLSNVLRLIGDKGLDQRKLGKLAILSRRALKVAVRNADEMGWLRVENVPKVRGLQMLRLTPAGRKARTTGERLIKEVESSWRGRFGNDRVAELHKSLAALAEHFEIELPYYLTGYGPEDLQVTGGNYNPEQPGPPRSPAHGLEWPVVFRDPEGDVADLPLPALLSQVLAAFTIDYERERLGWLAIASQFVHLVADEGTTLGQISQSAGSATRASLKYWVNGSGKPLLERHLIVVVEPGKPHDMNRRVYLTPKGRRMRDSYPCAVMEIEQNWQSLYGSDLLANLRTTLESLDRDFAAGLPEYPNNTAWFYQWRWQSEAF